jgi:ATP-dependent DNA ligase
MNFFYPPQPSRIWPDSDIFKSLCNNQGYDAEIKANGWRILSHIDDTLKLYNRDGTIIDVPRDLFSLAFKGVPKYTIFDGELINFRTKDVKNIIVLFDCMFYKGKDLRSLPLFERRKYLNDFDKQPKIFSTKSTGKIYRIAQYTTNIEALYFDIIKRNDPLEEGIILKKKSSTYSYFARKGVDILDWIKVKKESNSAKVDQSH